MPRLLTVRQLLRILLPSTIFAFGAALSVPIDHFRRLVSSESRELILVPLYSGPAKLESGFYRLLESLPFSCRQPLTPFHPRLIRITEYTSQRRNCSTPAHAQTSQTLSPDLLHHFRLSNRLFPLPQPATTTLTQSETGCVTPGLTSVIYANLP